jgi:Protein of Unknown function (DUF2784)
MIAAAIFVLFVHLAWILFVIFGTIWTRRRPMLTAVHVLALVWGIIVEVGPWPCPLTLAEEFFERRAGLATDQGNFVVHFLDLIVYPQLPDWAITVAGVAVCLFNLGIYAWRIRTLARPRSRL